jgi:cell division protein FtsI/penicillin-binding protein 2
MKTELSWRFNFLGGLFIAVAFLIIVQIIRVQASPQAEDLLQEGVSMSRTLHYFFPARGQIYDRMGNLLAGNMQVYEVGAEVYYVRNSETIAFALSKILVDHPEYNRPEYYEGILDTIEKALRDGNSYVTLADFVTEEELDELKEWAQRYEAMSGGKYKDVSPPSLRGLVYRPRMKRIYPEEEMASNLLGFVNRLGEGVFGVEEQYNSLLAGKPEVAYLPLDPYQVVDLPEIKGAADLILTIDREIQANVEDVLDAALVESGSESGTIVVMDPQNGEILALATTPRLDINQYWDYEKIFPDRTPYNRGVSATYEPGSVFKIFTMAAALDVGAVEPDTQFIDTGVFEIGGIYIYNWNYGAWGPQDMRGCMAHSLNVCLSWVASQLGVGDFYRYLQDFGIGHVTGIDIAGEAPGRLKLPGDEDWYEAELGTNSFGQGVAVTPVQMAMGASAIANEGIMVSPHMVRSIVKDGAQFNPTPTIAGNPIKAETARTLTEMLASSLENESSDALITGYRVAGKTGTAEIPSLAGYSSSLTNASFVGWGPIENPRFLVYVWLEMPTSSPWGSVVAAPVFREVVERLVVLMDIPPDDVRRRLEGN